MAKVRKGWVAPKPGDLAKCATCRHPKVDEINMGFVTESHNWKTFPEIYGISYSNSRHNHFGKHVSPEDKALLYAKAKAKATNQALNEIEGDKINVLHSLTRLSEETQAFLEKAKTDDDLKGGIAAIAELRKQLKQVAEILAQQTTRDDVVTAQSPAWQSVKKTLMVVLDNHPAAKAEFIQRMGQLAIEA